MWPSCVTREPCEDRQPGPLAHKWGLDRPLGILTLSPAPPFLWPGRQPHPAGQGGTYATGVRNLGPEPHKARAAFTAWLCCQLPMTRLLKLPPSLHIPFMASYYVLAPRGSAHHLAWRLTAPPPPLSQTPLPKGHEAAGLHPEPQFHLEYGVIDNSRC